MDADEARILAFLRDVSPAAEAESESLALIARNLQRSTFAEDSDAEELANIRRNLETRSQVEDDAEELRQIEANLRRGVADLAIVRALLPSTRRATGDDWRAARRNGLEWQYMGFTAEEVREWTAAGVYPEEPRLADRLMGEGVTPSMARWSVTHADTGERMSVVELGRAALEDAYLSLAGHLDAAGVERDPSPRGRPSRRWAV